MKTKILLTIMALVGISITTMAQQLQSGSKFPVFSTTDVWGRNINSINTSGKTWWLFQRNVGCPVCNLRMHQIGKLADSLTQSGSRVIVILESPASRIKEYLGNTPGTIVFVSDPERKLYDMVGAERSMGKMLKGVFHGLMGKANKGQQLMGKKVKQDGHSNTIPSEFVVDENGTTQMAFYAKFAGQEPEIADISKIIAASKVK